MKTKGCYHCDHKVDQNNVEIIYALISQVYSGIKYQQCFAKWGAHAQWQCHYNKKGKRKSRPYLSECRRGSKYETEQRRGRKDEKEQKKQKANVWELFIRDWRPTRKEKTSPQRLSFFFNNCIVFKVQDFYIQKYSCVGLSTPKEKKENRRKAQTLGRRVRKAKQNTELRKWIYREEDESNKRKSVL